MIPVSAAHTSLVEGTHQDWGVWCLKWWVRLWCMLCLIKPESVRGQRWESYIWGQCFPAISTCLSPGEVESALKTWQIFSPRAQQWQRRLHPGQVLPGQGLPGILLCHRTPPVPRSWEFQAPIGIFHSSPGQGALHNPRDPSTLLRPIWDQPWHTGAK